MLHYFILFIFNLHALSQIAYYSVTLLNPKPRCKKPRGGIVLPTAEIWISGAHQHEQQLEFPLETQRSHLHDSKCSQYWIFAIYTSYQNGTISSIL